MIHHDKTPCNIMSDQRNHSIEKGVCRWPMTWFTRHITHSAIQKLLARYRNGIACWRLSWRSPFLQDLVSTLIQRPLYDGVSPVSRMYKSRNQSAEAGLTPLIITLSDSPGKLLLPIPATLGALPSKRNISTRTQQEPLLNYQLGVAS